MDCTDGTMNFALEEKHREMGLVSRSVAPENHLEQ